MPKNLAFFGWGGRKWLKIWLQVQENQIGENGGERKINPSANPDLSVKQIGSRPGPVFLLDSDNVSE